MLARFNSLSLRAKIIRVIIAIVLVAQVFQPDRTAPTHAPSADLIAATQPSAEVAQLLRTACYDCHSDEASYPWYSYFTPVNFWLQHHIDEGREEGNLSDWTNMPERQRAHFVDEAEELILAGEMPMPNYTWMHSGAKPNAEQRKLLADWFQSLPEAAIEWRRRKNP